MPRTHRVRVVEEGGGSSALLVLGVTDFHAAARLLPEDVQRNGWGGSFGGHYVLRGKGPHRRWRGCSHADYGYPLPKDAIPGVLFTGPKRDPR